MKRIIWFRWGTYETYKFDARSQQWSKYDTDLNQDQIPPFKHLLFASITHLPDGLGAYLTGGSDELDNCYRRALLFQKYERFKIVASMIRNRAFHCSVYLKKRNEVYAIGGNQGGQVMTMRFVEALEIDNNVWVERAPMNIPREGASACVFETPLQIFVFGGSNM